MDKTREAVVVPLAAGWSGVASWAALQIMEIQSGSYLGEDDIVRLEDQYGPQGTTS